MAIYFVQSQQANSTAANIAVTLPRTPIQNNLLVAYYAANSANVTATITGWTPLTNSGTGTSARSNRMFYKIAGASESTTVTAASTAATASLVVLEYAGIDPLNPLLVQNSAVTTTASTTYTTPSVTPAAGVAALVVAGVMQKQNANTPFTSQQIAGTKTGVSVRSNPNATIKQDATVFDQFINSTSGAYVGTAVQATSLVGAGAIAIFRAATTTGKILAYDAFTGTNGNAWSSQWTQLTGATDGTATIQSNTGRLSSSTNGYVFGGEKLANVSAVNLRVVADFTLNGDGSEQYPYVGLRSDGQMGNYYPSQDYWVKFYTDGSAVDFGQHYNNEDGYLNAPLTGGTASSTFHLDFSVIDSQFTGYVWIGSDAKPSTPSFSGDTGGGIYNPGTLTIYQGNGQAGTSRNYNVDNLILTTGQEFTNTGQPTISGSAYTSNVISVSNGSWSQTPDSYLYQWYRDGITISGATSSTYTVVAGDSGTQLSVYVQAVKAEYATVGIMTSSVLAAGQGINNTALPVISGTASLGQSVSSSTGSWSQTPDSYTYQWNRNGVAIAGATSSTYTIVNADLNLPLTVTVNAIKASYANGNATSNAVTPGSSVANTTPPVISGSAIRGQTLSTTDGVWSPTPDSYSYQWNRDGSAISGATSQTYTLTALDDGLPITATVTAVKGSGSTPATSNVITPSAASVTDKLSFWHAALTNRATASATITTIGGLTSEGQGASQRSSRWVSRLRDALRRNYRTSGVVGGEGYVPGGYNVTDFSASWATSYTSGTGTYNYAQWSADLGYRLITLDVSSSVTYTFYGTDLDLWYTTGYGGFSYAIDGGTATHVNSATDYFTSATIPISNLAVGTHIITLSTNSNESAAINGIFIYNGDKTKGIKLADASHTGYTLANFNGDQNHFVIAIDTTNPSLIILELGSYDAVSVTPSVFQKQLQNFINTHTQTQITYSNPLPSILIVANYQPGTNVTSNFLAPWSQYVAAMQAVANYSQVGFLDLSAVMPQADTSGSGYYNTDGATVNDYGHAKIAQLVFNAIADSNASYNTSLNTWYTALANRASTPAKWLAIGDSITEGQGASNIVSRWLTKTHQLLKSNYPVFNVGGGAGYRPGGYNVYAPDSPWSNWFSASSGAAAGQNDAGAGPGYRLTYLQQNASRTYPFYGTDIDVWVYGGGGTISYNIDGGASTTVTTTNNGATTISSKTGLTRGQHTITVTTPSAGGASFSGFMIYDGDRSKGIQLYDSAHSGAKTSLFLSDLTNFTNNVNTISPDLITIDIGPNDMATDNVSTVLNNVFTLVNKLSDSTKTPSIAMIVPYIISSNVASPTSTQTAYSEAYKMIAQAVGGTFIDFSSFLPTTDTSGTGYYRTDGIHANDSGHALIAQNVIQKLSDTRITPSTTGTVLATETWTVPDSASWPAQWTVSVNSGATINTQNGAGYIQSTTTAGNLPGSTYLSGMRAVSDIDIQFDFMIPDTTLEQYALVGARVQSATFQSTSGDPTTGYIFNVYPKTNSVEILLSSDFTSYGTASYTFTSGTIYSVRYQLIGTTIRARVWVRGNAEPSTWLVSSSSATDKTPGKVALFTENGWDANNTAAVIYYDNFTALAPLPKVYVGNQVRPMGYVGSRPIVSVYVGANRIF